MKVNCFCFASGNPTVVVTNGFLLFMCLQCRHRNEEKNEEKKKLVPQQQFSDY